MGFEMIARKISLMPNSLTNLKILKNILLKKIAKHSVLLQILT